MDLSLVLFRCMFLFQISKRVKELHSEISTTIEGNCLKYIISLGIMPKDVKSKVTVPKTVLDKVGYIYMYLVFSLPYFHFV